MSLFKIKSGILSLVDKVNQVAEPFEPFTRAIIMPPGEAVSPSRIDQLAKYYSEQMRDFIVEEGHLYIYSNPNDLGDLCIWQGVYTGMLCMKAKASGTSESRIGAMLAMRGLLMHSEDRLLRGVTTIDPSIFIYRPDGSKGRQYWVGTDYRLRREDASLDSLAGWIYGVACAIRHLDVDDLTMNRISSYAKKFMSDGFRLLNRDGSVTTHGDIRPGFFQAPVRNLAAVCMARLCHFSPVTNIWRNYASRYKQDFTRTETHVLWKHGYYNDNVAILLGAAYLMLTDSWDPGHDEAKEGLRILANKQKNAGNAFLIYLCKSLGIELEQRQYQIADQVLGEFSLAGYSKHPGVVRNSLDSHIKKVEWGGKQYAAQPLPIWRRPPQDFHWQRNPYQLDDGTDNCYNGLDFLAAYWARKLS